MDTWFLSPPLDILLLPLGWSTFFSLAAGLSHLHVLFLFWVSGVGSGCGQEGVPSSEPAGGRKVPRTPSTSEGRSPRPTSLALSQFLRHQGDEKYPPGPCHPSSLGYSDLLGPCYVQDRPLPSLHRIPMVVPQLLVNLGLVLR